MAKQKDKWRSDDLRIRPMTGKDLPVVAVLERKSFSEPWTEAGFADAIRQQQNLFLVAELQQETILGYIGLYGSFDEGDITNVAVDEAFRGQGVGFLLVKNMKEMAFLQGIRQIFLEVRVSNKIARRLYGSLGFEECGRRRNFYREPVEDAILMRVDLNSETESDK